MVLKKNIFKNQTIPYILNKENLVHNFPIRKLESDTQKENFQLLSKFWHNLSFKGIN